MAVAMILIQLLLFLHLKTTESAKSTIALPGCPESCDGIPIPYPFGIGLKCSLSEHFNVTCDTTYNNGTPTPYLMGFIQILNINLSLGEARVGSGVNFQCHNNTTKKLDIGFAGFGFGSRSPIWVNTEKNKFTVLGCNTLAYLAIDWGTNYTVGCLSSCDSLATLNKYGPCSGIGCCQTAIPRETNSLISYFDTRYNNLGVYNFSPCSYAMVLEEAQFKFDPTYITTNFLSSSQTHDFLFSGPTLPMLVNWAIGNTPCDITQKNKSSYACRSDHSVCLNSTSTHGGYLCNCSYGYEGNPYLDGGCQDIDECANQNACSKPGNTTTKRRLYTDKNGRATRISYRV